VPAAQPSARPLTLVGVAGFEPAASSSRSQVQTRTASTAAFLAWDGPSVGVRWRPPLSVAIVTHFVIRPFASGRERLLPHTLSKSARQGSATVMAVCDLG
jgi:hypothetical protein